MRPLWHESLRYLGTLGIVAAGALGLGLAHSAVDLRGALQNGELAGSIFAAAMLVSASAGAVLVGWMLASVAGAFVSERRGELGLTARRRTIAESEARYAAMLASIPDVTWTVDSSGAAVYMSPNVVDVYGLTAEEVINGGPCTWFGHVHPDDRPALEAAFGTLMAGGSFDIEYRVRRKDGEWVWLRDRSGGTFERGGELFAHGIFTDITRRKNAEAVLRASEERFQAIFRWSPAPIVLFDLANGKLADMNAALEEVIGIPRDALIGRTAEELGIESPLMPLGDALQALLRGEALDDLPMVVTLPGGRRKELLASARAIELGGRSYMLGLAIDVTGEREAQARLAESEARYATLLADIPDVTWTADSTGTAVYMSPNIVDVCGFTVQEALDGGPEVWFGHVHPDDLPALEAAFETLMAGGSFDIEYRFQRKDGEWIWLHDRSRGTFERDGELYANAIFSDVTERKQMEAALMEAHERAEAASRARSEFLSRASHELRTPLNIMLGWSQVLQMDASKEQEEGLGHVIEAGRALLAMIDEVLDISRADAGQLRLAIGPLSVREALRESAAPLRLLAESLDVSMPADFPDAAVLADRQRLGQVLLNLLGNAVLYNRRGGSVEVSCEPVTGGRVRIIVRDTGQGIPPEKLGRLFDPFDRLGAETTGVPGTGLGLPLSKRLAEAMDGGIGFESAAGKGSAFWVELPAAPPG